MNGLVREEDFRCKEHGQDLTGESEHWGYRKNLEASDFSSQLRAKTRKTEKPEPCRWIHK
jgi:hypothetical protein